MRGLLLFLFIAVLMPAASAQGSSSQSWGNTFSPGEARDAVRKGDIVPLNTIFQRLRDRYGGYQLDAELFSTRGGGSEYRIRWMTEDGRRLNIRVDGRTGRILSATGG